MTTIDKGWKGFIQLCEAADKEDNLSAVLNCFLTPEEKENLALRYLVVEALIKKHKTQREIAKELKVSIARITRGSNALKNIKKELLQYLDKYFEITTGH